MRKYSSKINEVVKYDKCNIGKDEHILDLKGQIDDDKKQINQLHTIILATQKDNQL